MKLFCFVILCFLIASCSDDELLKGNLYVFKGETITQYVNHQEELSMFAKLLEKSYNSGQSRTTVAALLGSRGNYSAFIPTNKAVATYLDSIYGRGNYDIDSIPEAVANRIVLNCVMDFGDKTPILSTDFWEGTVPESMLNDNNLLIQYGNYGNGITTQINRSSYVVKHDIELSNGLAHWVDRVIEPTPQSVSMLIKDVDSLSIFYHLLEATSWADSLVRFRDVNYVLPSENKPFGDKAIDYRVFGYTVFAETNNVFHEKWGVPLPRYNNEDGHVENWNEIMDVITQRCAEVYPNSSSCYTDTDNSLNRFVAYHIVDGKYDYGNLVNRIHEGKFSPFNLGFSLYPPIDSWRYYCTKGRAGNLFKITHVVKDGTMRINRKSFYNNSFNGDYKETSCPIGGICVQGDTKAFGANYSRNGYYYTLDDILLFTDEVKHVVLNERIRYDMTHIMPEIASAELLGKYQYLSFPWNYFNNFSCDDNMSIVLVDGKDPADYEGNSFLLYPYDANSSKGKSFVIQLMPVPFAGKWQVRMDYSIDSNVKSYEDAYFGPVLNVNKMQRLDIEPEIFNKTSYVRKSIYKQDVQFDDDSMSCMENDKQLQLHQLMKAPKSIPIANSMTHQVYVKKAGGVIKAEDRVTNITGRDIKTKLRVILYEGYMEPDKTYYLCVKHKLDLDELTPVLLYSNRMIDYFELVPESVYGNPARAEDIW